MTELARELLAYLQKHAIGEDRAKTRSFLCAVLGCTDRQPRAAVQELRKAHRGICTRRKAPGGYYYAEHVEQIEETAKDLEKQAFDLLERAYGLRRAYGLPVPKYQLRLPGFGAGEAAPASIVDSNGIAGNIRDFEPALPQQRLPLDVGR